MLEIAVHVRGAAWVQMFPTGTEPVRKGNGYPSAAPAAEVIAVGDGRIVLSAYTADQDPTGPGRTAPRALRPQRAIRPGRDQDRREGESAATAG